jgi:hypothetical protein
MYTDLSKTEKAVLKYFLARACKGRPHVILSRATLSRDLGFSQLETDLALLMLETSGCLIKGGHRGRLPRGCECWTPRLKNIKDHVIEF